MLDNALDRELYETNYNPASPAPTSCGTEGDPFPGALNPDQQNEVIASGESYWFFQNVFGRDSYDGNGATRDHGQQRPDASRAPTPTGTASPPTTAPASPSDDVVAHEWGHAYTEYTQRPDLPVAVRCAQRVLLRHLGRDPRPDQQPRWTRARATSRPRVRTACARRLHPRRRPADRSTAPASIAGSAQAAPAAFGPAITATGITDDIVRGHGRRRRDRPADDRRLLRRSTNAGGRQRQVRATSTAAPAPSTVKVDQRRGRRRHRHRRRQQRRRRRSSRCPATGTHPRPDDHPGRRARRSRPAAAARSHGTMRPSTDSGPKADSYRWLVGREVHGLRRRDPRHVEPELLRRRGQGQ